MLTFIKIVVAIISLWGALSTLVRSVWGSTLMGVFHYLWIIPKKTNKMETAGGFLTWLVVGCSFYLININGWIFSPTEAKDWSDMLYGFGAVVLILGAAYKMWQKGGKEKALKEGIELDNKLKLKKLKDENI